VAYTYHEEVVNKNRPESFFKKVNFIGYILDDGTIYRAKNHNIESMSSFFSMTLINLINNFQDKDIILDLETNDRIGQILINYFRHASYDELVALEAFIEKYNLGLSDLLVSYFRCHLVTRLDREIITASNDFEPFHNYILMGFGIRKVDKMVYKNKEFKFVDDTRVKNDCYLDNMNKLMSEISDEDRKLFFR
jgi:hypothetical protein